jgi:hypothetical protein
VDEEIISKALRQELISVETEKTGAGDEKRAISD